MTKPWHETSEARRVEQALINFRDGNCGFDLVWNLIGELVKTSLTEPTQKLLAAAKAIIEAKERGEVQVFYNAWELDIDGGVLYGQLEDAYRNLVGK